MGYKFNPLTGNFDIDNVGAPGAGDGLNRIAAGTQTAGTLATIAFSNSNNVSFGMSNSSIVTASASFSQSVQTQNMVSVQGSTGNISFSNANGITFGANVSTITASHNALTTARASNDAIGLNTAFTNVTATVNSSGLSLNAAGYAGTNTATTGNISVTLNSSGLSLNAPAFLTTAAQSNHSHAFSASGGSSNFQTLNFANSNGITFSNSNGSVIASHNGLTTARASNDAVGLNTAATNVTWTVNSSGISLNAGAYLTTAMASNRGSDFVQATAAFAGTNASGTIASNGISVSVAAPGGGAAPTASASNGSFTFNTIGFSNANNVTFGTSAGSIITASVAAPGGGAGFTANSTAIGMENAWAQSSSSLGQNSLYIQPHNLQVALSAIAVKLPVMITNSSLASSSGQIGHTVQFGIYTTNATNSTVLALHYSTTYTAALSNSSNASRAVSLISAINNSTSYATFNSTSAGLNLSSIVHGPREFLMPISSLLTAGKYWFALRQSTSGGGTSNSVFAVSNIIYSSQTNAPWGATSATSLGGIAKNIGLGTYSAATAAMPTNISITEINKAATQPVMYIVDATS